MKGFTLFAMTVMMVAIAACDRVVGPNAKPRTLVPAVHIDAGRFDTIAWPMHQRRVGLADPSGLLATLARLLRFPPNEPPRVTGIEIRDEAGWGELWSRVAVGDSVRPVMPTVDFSRDMVYVVVGEQRADHWPISALDIDVVVRHGGRYSVYTSYGIGEARESSARLVDAVILPTTDIGVTLFITGKSDGSTAAAPRRQASPSSRPTPRSAPTPCCAPRH